MPFSPESYPHTTNNILKITEGLELFNHERQYSTKGELFKKLKLKVKDFCLSCLYFKDVIDQKHKQEKDAELIHQAIWKFISQRRTSSYKLSDGSFIEYIYEFYVAQYNQDYLQQFTNVTEHLQNYIPSVYLNLYFRVFMMQQSMVSVILDLISQGQVNWNDEALYQQPHRLCHCSTNTLLYIIQCMLDVLSDPPTRPQPLPFMARDMIDNTIVFISYLTQFSTDSETKEINNSGYILQLILNRPSINIDTLSMAFYPTPKDIYKDDLINRLLVSHLPQDKTSSPQIVEPFLLRLLKQIPIHQLSSSEKHSINADEAKSAVIVPIQAVLNRYPHRNYLQLILQCIKFVVLTINQFPELGLLGLSIITRSAWPSKLIAVPVMYIMMPWSQLNAACEKDNIHLETFFNEIYHLYGENSLDKIKANDLDTHRSEYIDQYLIPHRYLVQQIYSVDNNLAKNNQGRLFPFLNIAAAIVLQQCQDGFIESACRVFREVFAFAFIIGTTKQEHLRPLNDLRGEAVQVLKHICQCSDQCMEFFVHRLRHSISFIIQTQPQCVNTIETCIRGMDLTAWRLTPEAVENISGLVRGAVPPSPFPGRPASPVKVRHHCERLGRYLLSPIIWAHQTPSIRRQGLEMLLKTAVNYDTGKYQAEGYRWVIQLLSQKDTALQITQTISTSFVNLDSSMENVNNTDVQIDNDGRGECEEEEQEQKGEEEKTEQFLNTMLFQDSLHNCLHVLITMNLIKNRLQRIKMQEQQPAEPLLHFEDSGTPRDYPNNAQDSDSGTGNMITDAWRQESSRSDIHSMIRRIVSLSTNDAMTDQDHKQDQPWTQGVPSLIPAMINRLVECIVYLPVQERVPDMKFVASMMSRSLSSPSTSFHPWEYILKRIAAAPASSIRDALVSVWSFILTTQISQPHGSQLLEYLTRCVATMNLQRSINKEKPKSHNDDDINNDNDDPLNDTDNSEHHAKSTCLHTPNHVSQRRASQINTLLQETVNPILRHSIGVKSFSRNEIFALLSKGHVWLTMLAIDNIEPKLPSLVNRFEEQNDVEEHRGSNFQSHRDLFTPSNTDRDTDGYGSYKVLSTDIESSLWLYGDCALKAFDMARTNNNNKYQNNSEYANNIHMDVEADVKSPSRSSSTTVGNNSFTSNNPFLYFIALLWLRFFALYGQVEQRFGPDMFPSYLRHRYTGHLQYVAREIEQDSKTSHNEPSETPLSRLYRSLATWDMDDAIPHAIQTSLPYIVGTLSNFLSLFDKTGRETIQDNRHCDNYHTAQHHNETRRFGLNPNESPSTASPNIFHIPLSQGLTVRQWVSQVMSGSTNPFSSDKSLESDIIASGLGSFCESFTTHIDVYEAKTQRLRVLDEQYAEMTQDLYENVPSKSSAFLTSPSGSRILVEFPVTKAEITDSSLLQKLKENRYEHGTIHKELHHCSQQLAINAFTLKIITNRILDHSKDNFSVRHVIIARNLYLSLADRLLSSSIANKMPLVWRYMTKHLERLGSCIIGPHDADAQLSVFTVITSAAERMPPSIPPPIPPLHHLPHYPGVPAAGPSASCISPSYTHYQYQDTQQQYPSIYPYPAHHHHKQQQQQNNHNYRIQDFRPSVVSERLLSAPNSPNFSAPPNFSHYPTSSTSQSSPFSPCPPSSPLPSSDSLPKENTAALATYLQQNAPPPTSMPARTAPSSTPSHQLIHGKNKSWETDRRRLFTAFRAMTVLEKGDPERFFTLIQRWATMGTHLSSNEENLLSHQFSLPRVPKIHPDISDEHIRILVDSVRQCLQRTNRRIFSIQLLQALVCIRFPESVDRLLDSVLASCRNGECVVDNWDQGFTETLPISDASPRLVVNWLIVVNQHLPLPPQFTPAVLRLFEFLVCRPGFETYLSRSDSESKSVTALCDFFGHCLPQVNQAHIAVSPDGNITSQILGIYHRVLSQVMRGVPLLNESLWEIYMVSVFPLCVTAPECASQTQAFLSSIDWETATLHHNPEVLERLWLCIPYNPGIVAFIVSAVNWESVLNADSEHALNNLQLLSRVKCKLLKIILDLNVCLPNHLPQPLKTLLEHAASRKHESDLRIPYDPLPRGILVEDFVAEFPGHVLFRLLRYGAISHNPGESLMLNSMALMDVAFHVDDSAAAIACAQEIRSIMFVTITGGTNNYWQLSLDHHSSLILDALIPLTRRYGSPPLIECLFTCMEACRRGNPPVMRNGCIGFANSLDPFFDEDHAQQVQHDDEGLRSFIDKVYNLISLFCSGASETLCVEMLNTVPSIIENNELLCMIMEDITRQYLKQSHSTNPRYSAASSLALNSSITPFSDSFTNFIQCCISTKSFLFMTIIFHQLLSRTTENTEPDATDTSFHVQSTIIYIGSFIVKAEPKSSGRDYEILYLYFFFLELLEHRSWDFQDSQLDSLYHTFQSALGKIAIKKSFWKKTMKREQHLSAPLVLAGYAISIFSSRIREDYYATDNNQLLRKSIKTDSKKKLEQLLKLKEDPTFKEYGDFFEDSTGLISSLIDIETLRDLIVDQLFPLCSYITKV